MASMDVALMKLSEALENLMVICDVLVKMKKKKLKSPPTCRRMEKSTSTARNRHSNNSINPATGKYLTRVSYSPILPQIFLQIQ